MEHQRATEVYFLVTRLATTFCLMVANRKIWSPWRNTIGHPWDVHINVLIWSQWFLLSKCLFFLYRAHSVQVSTYMSVQVSTYVSVQVSTYMSIQVATYMSIQVATYMSVQVATYMSVQVATYMSVLVATYISVQVATNMSVQVSTNMKNVVGRWRRCSARVNIRVDLLGLYHGQECGRLGGQGSSAFPAGVL